MIRYQCVQDPVVRSVCHDERRTSLGEGYGQTGFRKGEFRGGKGWSSSSQIPFKNGDLGGD